MLDDFLDLSEMLQKTRTHSETQNELTPHSISEKKDWLLALLANDERTVFDIKFDRKPLARHLARAS